MVVTKDQGKPCDTEGEPYRPVPVDVVLGRDDVVLRSVDGQVLVTAPTAADLATAPDDAALDFPGSALDPGCSYEQWFHEIADGVPTTVYAHVAGQEGHPGKLALQYWFYWPFNDWNNKHESDWEMIQLLFDADTATEALATEPTEVGFAQHEGAERSDWSGDHLTRDGDHPIVYPAARSHSSQFSSALYLGYSAASGVGCDDTTGPSTSTQADVIVLPDAPSGADDPFAWLDFRGRWGEYQKGPNKGPTGPATKDRWDEPISYADDWNNNALIVPASSGFSPSTTDFFCGAVARGSEFYLRFLQTPWTAIALLVAFVVIVVLLVRRTQWRPGTLEPIDARRRSGELFRAAARFVRQRWRLVLGIGIVFIPIGIVFALLQNALFEWTPLGTVVDLTTGDRLIGGIIALAIGTAGTIIATVVVQAAMARAVDRTARGEDATARDAYRAVVRHAGALAWAALKIVVVVALLCLTIVGIPFAIVYAVRRTVAAQAIMIEDRDADDGIARSRELVAPRTWPTLWVSAATNLLAGMLGPLLGVLLLFVWGPSLRAVNFVSGLTYAVVMPYTAIVLALLFYDLRRRAETPDVDPESAAEPVPA